MCNELGFPHKILRVEESFLPIFDLSVLRETNNFLIGEKFLSSLFRSKMLPVNILAQIAILLKRKCKNE